MARHSNVRQEGDRIHAVAVTITLFAAVIIAAAGVLWAWLTLRRDAPAPPAHATAQVERVPTAPPTIGGIRQTLINADTATQRLAERKRRRLGSYGWVDSARGVARIPIEQAMRVIAESTAAATPAPAPPASGRRSRNPMDAATIRERTGQRLPLELAFRDARGRTVRLADLLPGDRPAVLVLAYYHCRTLCDLVLDGAARALRESGLRPGADYRAITVGIDPRETPEDARAERARVLALLGGRTHAATPVHAPGAPPASTREEPVERAADGVWPFLVGDSAQIHALARALGFGYRYDPATDQFAHPAAVFVLTPDGRISSYLYGIAPAAAEVADALATAARGRTRSVLDRVLLRCFHYIPALRRHGGLIAGVTRGGSILVLLVLGAVLFRIVRARRRAGGPA
ncbi:MAG TPA: SCO family protein [Longimicrobiales bacterium]